MSYYESYQSELDQQEFEFRINLHPVFETVLDTYANVKDAPHITGHITLWDALQKIRYNLFQDITPQMFLTQKYVDGIFNDEYDDLKEHLPAICYNASFHGYKKLKNIKKIHNLMFLDIDNFSTKEEALAYKAEIIRKYDWILACNLSLSKIGLHVITMVDKITDSDDYNRKYVYISKEYFYSGLDLDSKSLSRFTIIPYDHNIFINENPVILPIDSIISKSMGSVYITSNSASRNGSSSNELKSTGSVYTQSSSQHDKEKSTSSVLGGEGICTTHTFADSPNLNELLNTSASENGLIFKPFANEDLIEDPDKPLFNKNGFPVVEINLFLYSNKSVTEGRRTSFIGAIISQMIYLNVILPDKPNPNVRENLLRFIRSVNRKYCNPSLPNDEMLKSYNYHWKRYHEGNLDITKYLKLRKSLWSLNCSLTGNEKRSETMTRIHKYKREDKLEILFEVIQQMADNGEKITQQLVADEIKKQGIKGLGITTIKNLWEYFKPSVQAYKKGISNEIIITEIDSKSILKTRNRADIKDVILIDDDALDVGKELLENHKNILAKQGNGNKTDEGFSITEEQQSSIYNRIYSNILNKLSEDDKNELHQLYRNMLDEMDSDGKKILCMDTNSIIDGDIYWKQSRLENELFSLCNKLNLSI